MYELPGSFRTPRYFFPTTPYLESRESLGIGRRRRLGTLLAAGPSMAVLSGVVSEDGEGFIVLRTGPRVTRVRSNVRPADLIIGARVLVTAQLRGAEWVAEHVEVEG